jgi:NAD-dependent DNA ligase
MATDVDDHGQPVIREFNAARRTTRAVHELIGFLRGIIADKYVSEEETESLAKWCVANREVADIWPVSTIVRRIDAIYADGVVTAEERSDLADLITEIVGKQDDDTLEFGPTDLPLTKPAPDVVFDRNEFVFTGKFLYGPRKMCEKAVAERGGRCSGIVRLQTSFVVIGSRMSPDWKFSNFGNKIAKAAEYCSRGDCPIAIVSEKHWESFLW